MADQKPAPYPDESDAITVGFGDRPPIAPAIKQYVEDWLHKLHESGCCSQAALGMFEGLVEIAKREDHYRGCSGQECICGKKQAEDLLEVVRIAARDPKFFLKCCVEGVGRLPFAKMREEAEKHPERIPRELR